ncbi:hypothetical protein MIR68_002766 [Amoeboaphelidium protococcarum]|nr:hypothetical protein MIR68_002766 [Amoeboaphelidium protococcarum]
MDQDQQKQKRDEEVAADGKPQVPAVDGTNSQKAGDDADVVKSNVEAAQTSESTTVTPADKINLRLLLTSGQKADFLFSAQDSILYVKNFIFEHWPKDWSSSQVENVDVIRILYRGRFLEDNLTFENLKIASGQTTTMHLVPKPTVVQSGKEDKRAGYSETTVAPFTACRANARFVCAGTEYQNYEAHVFIWDTLNLTDNPKYKLSESFGNDISCLRFHPYQDSLLYVSTTDGLISVIDINQLSSQTPGVDGEYDNGEGDALVQTLNVGSSVAKFEFFGQNAEFLWVITDMNSLQIWCGKTCQLFADHCFENGVWPLTCIFIPQFGMLFCLATSDKEGQVLIFKVLLDQIPQVAEFSISSTSSIRNILWCENQNAMISITEDGHISKSLVNFKNSAQ